MSLLRFSVSILLILFALTSEASESGYFGFGISIDGEGAFWNPTLKSVTVARVAPSSPAERAGLTVGDKIVEIEGRQVAGAKAQDLRPHMQKAVGQRVTLVVQKATGETKPVSMVAAPKPD